MTENPIVKMADSIRAKTGTTNKFTLPEMALIMNVSSNFPDFSSTVTVSKNGSSQALNTTISVNGGDTIEFTFNYTVTHTDLLWKLRNSNAKLPFSLPVIKYQDSDWTNKATAQTIHILRENGSELIASISIAAGDTNYSYVNKYIYPQLTDSIAEYLMTGRPIIVKYDNVGSHDNLKMSTDATLQLWLYQN
jgi:plastocyanin